MYPTLSSQCQHLERTLEHVQISHPVNLVRSHDFVAALRLMSGQQRREHRSHVQGVAHVIVNTSTPIHSIHARMFERLPTTSRQNNP